MRDIPRQHLRTRVPWSASGRPGHVWKLLRDRARFRPAELRNEPEEFPVLPAGKALPPKTIDELAEEIAAVMARRVR